MTKNDRRFQFLLEQFKLHSKRLHDFHSERYKITTWSILAIFGYYGWILTNSEEWKTFAVFVVALPIILALFGFGYLTGLNEIIDRHSAFLDRLEYEMSGRPDKFMSEWEKFKKAGHQGKPLRRTFNLIWAGLIAATVVAFFWLK